MAQKWFTLKRNATLHHVVPISKSIVTNLKDLIGIGFNKHACIFKNGEQLSWNYEVKGLDQVANFMLQNLNYEFNYNIEKKWRFYANTLEKIFKKLEKIKIDKISDKVLNQIYSDLMHNLEIESAYGTLSDFLSSDLIKNKVIEHLKNIPNIKSSDLDRMLGVATISIFKSPYAREQEEIFKLAIKKGSGENINKKIEEHANKYWFIQNDYKDSFKLTDDYFRSQIKSLLKNKNILKDYEESIKKPLSLVSEKKKLIQTAKKADIGFYELLRMIDIHVKLWDLKKVVMQKSFYYLDLLLKEIALRFNLSFEDIKWLSPEEVLLLFKNKKIKNIKSRKNSCILLVQTGSINILTGVKAKQIIKKVEGKIPKDLKELKGQIGNLGKIKGRVKKIFDPKNGKINQGEILVTGMTTPDFISLMKKAGAFITDEGGITCHAAIVARELNKPCVIGTKIATKVLKNGDLVEVDANKGVVKILKHGKNK